MVHPHHNYYEGRAEADLTPWLEYFLRNLAEVFAAVKKEAMSHAADETVSEPEIIRRLDPRARVVLALFTRKDRITSADVARALGLSDRMARVLLKSWVDDGFLEIVNSSRRLRSYGLSATYRQLIGN